MKSNIQQLAQQLLEAGTHELSAAECDVIARIAQGARVVRDANRVFDAELTFGERLADRVAAFGGSWTFITLFCAVLVAWILVNSGLLLARAHAFDPYPYILLNLVLSMLAACQAPIIMMSQNRLAAKDRLQARLDYEVNLKAELEISELHAKLDQLRDGQLVELLEMQREQIRLATALQRDRVENGGP